jgi:hypothetical protein
MPYATSTLFTLHSWPTPFSSVLFPPPYPSLAHPPSVTALVLHAVLLSHASSQRLHHYAPLPQLFGGHKHISAPGLLPQFEIGFPRSHTSEKQQLLYKL